MFLTIFWVTFILGVKSTSVPLLPLRFHFNENDGSNVWIRSDPSYGRLEQNAVVRYRSWIAENGRRTNAGQWQTMPLPNDSRDLDFFFRRYAGMCSVYEYEVQDRGNTYTQYMNVPEPRLSDRGRKITLKSLYLAPVTNFGTLFPTPGTLGQSNRIMRAEFNWDPQFLYWTSAARVTVLNAVPEISLVKCDRIAAYDIPYPNIKRIDNRNVQNEAIVEFAEEHARHGCTFKFRVTFVFEFTSERNAAENCRKIYTTDDYDSLEIKLDCNSLPDITCDRANSHQQYCDVDCRPIEITGQRARGSWNGQRYNEFFIFRWRFQHVAPNTREYRLRYGIATLTPFYAISSERNVIEVNVPTSQAAYQIEPPSGTSVNYTVQVCAMRQVCTRAIDWSKENKYLVEFKSEYDYKKYSYDSVVNPVAHYQYIGDACRCHMTSWVAVLVIWVYFWMF